VGGPQQGVYGLPQCLGENHVICDYVRRLLNYGAYIGWIQRLLVQVRAINQGNYNVFFLISINNKKLRTAQIPMALHPPTAVVKKLLLPGPISSRFCQFYGCLGWKILKLSRFLAILGLSRLQFGLSKGPGPYFNHY
jgi:hypothetical protein